MIGTLQNVYRSLVTFTLHRYASTFALPGFVLGELTLVSIILGDLA